jgi:GT2 family glycosyltransferase
MAKRKTEPRVSAPKRGSREREIEQLRSVVDEQRHELDQLSERVESLLDRQEWIQSGLYDLNLSLSALGRRDDGSQDGRVAYLESVRAVREVVRRKLPHDACIVVVSKGDELLDLYGRRAWHFPQGADGRYAGYYPPDGTAVIAHLEALRSHGADYLLFPKLALWWLDSYPKFLAHLHRHYPVVVDDSDKCLIFALERQKELPATVWRPRLLQLVEDYASEAGVDPAVLDWHTNLAIKELLPNQAVFSPPTEDTALPYLDGSVDIVVVSSPDATALREARRVAGHALVMLEPSEDEPRSDGHSGIPERLETSIERVNGEGRHSAPATSIVIPTYDGAEQLGRCLDALDDTLPDPFEGEVIVVDDGSASKVRELLDSWSDGDARFEVKVVRNRSNVGFVESCNRGAAAARGEILLFLNDDTLPQFGWLPALLRMFKSHPQAGAVGGKLLYPDGRLQEAGNVVYSDGSAANFGRGDYRVDDPIYNFVRAVDYCSGALLATPRKLFDEIGGFDKRYSPAYYEDADYCFAVRDRGYDVLYQPESVVVHVEGVTGGTDVTRGTKKFQVRNRERFAEKWGTALDDQPDPVTTYDLKTWYALADRGPAS